MKRSRFGAPNRGGNARPLLPPDLLPDVRRALLAHYDAVRRDLPWRGEEDPYRIWVSEVMLQQTRVETVIPYYRRWLERFPDVQTLASASEDEVLLAWQGLGYYRRARALHAGARMVRERHGAELPATAAALREIPGVGEYTAAAVASIAWGEVVGAVDGNVRRVLARLADRPRLTPRWLGAAAQELVDPDRPGDWNQAMMELGATVCTPRSPRCGGCPLAAWCAARAAGTQEERPAPSVRKAVPQEERAVAVVVDGRGGGLVIRRPTEGLLAGMWSFPDAAIASGRGPTVGEEGEPGAETGPSLLPHALTRGARVAARAAGVRLPPTSHGGPIVLPTVVHRFTHLAVTYHPVVLAGDAEEGEDRRWIPLAGPWPVALPVAQQKMARAAAGVAAPSSGTPRRRGTGPRRTT